jgi:hypothetical protein
MIADSPTNIRVEHLSGNRSIHVHKDDSAFGNFTYISPQAKSVEYRFETSAATLCFIRGTGKIAINGSLLEYDRKWFEIPQFVEYEILPETDTVMLTILKPIEDTNNDSFWRQHS